VYQGPCRYHAVFSSQVSGNTISVVLRVGKEFGAFAVYECLHIQ